MKWHTGLAAMAFVGALTTSASAATLFSANFNNGDLSGWSLATSNYAGPSGIETVPNGTLNGTNALGVYLDKFGPPFVEEFNLFVDASNTFTTSLATNVNLSLEALSVVCQGCIISYYVEFDGTRLATAASQGSVHDLSFNLGVLAAGSHTLTLGMHTTRAVSGRFESMFDNILLTGDVAVGAVPLPGALPLFASVLGLGGFFGWKRKRRVAMA